MYDQRFYAGGNWYALVRNTQRLPTSILRLASCLPLVNLLAFSK